MVSRNRTTVLWLAVVLLAVFASGCSSNASQSKGEAWKPTKPLTIVVPSKPGGGHDTTARIFAQFASKYAGQPVNILNEDQGAGVVAYTKVLQAPPDGYTIGQMAISLVTDQYLVPGVQYKYDSFRPICQIAADPNCLVVKKGGPYDKALDEFIAFAKQNPQKIRIGVSGNWTNHDYVREQIEMATGVKFQRVSVKGGAQIVMSILAGDLDAGVPYPSEIAGQVDSGQLKVLAHSGLQRLAAWPDVPTFTEKGIAVDLSVWRILAVPRGTPDNIAKGLYDIFEKAMNDPDLKKAYKDAGIGYVFKGPDATNELIKASHETYKKIIDRAGLMKK